MITVVVATLDRPEHLKRCVASVLAGERAPHEIIVVDQSADDRTRREVEALHPAPVRWVRQPERSTSLARNLGVGLATTAYVALLDDDGEVGPTWLRDVGRALEELGEPDLLFGALEAPAPVAPRSLLVSTHAIPRPTVWTAGTHPARPGFGGHVVVRRESFLASGGFDPRLGPGSPFFGAEDIDFNYRQLRAGRVVASSPDVRMVHHQWREEDRLPRLMYGYNLGHSAFCAKHLRRGDLRVLALVGRQAVDDARMLASAVRRRSALRARVALWRAAGTWRGLFDGWRAFGRGA